jgi:hypothetical protein
LNDQVSVTNLDKQKGEILKFSAKDQAKIKEVRLNVRRNLEDIPFTTAMNIGQRIKLMRDV